MAALLPAVTRMAALQKQCAAELPSMFSACEVLQCEAGQLVLSAPNAALATKLKQQLPRLQSQLQTGNWQINAIRIKVQVSQNLVKPPVVKQALLSSNAVLAFAALMEDLPSSAANETLKNAIAAMVARHRNKSAKD
ncbi:Zn-ribbon-containing [Collimonas arenae]|uniref:Zn-ribbon-containing n=1 Tax=Collimonas arenae TaxID=279058 RepID=A0A0A1FJ13_9BURK|nr:Zn-ribbon-containing [Collimonas arenae]